MKQLPDKNSHLSELMPFKKIRYVITDVDGTLTNGFDTVFERITSIIAYLRTKKITFSIATGRSLYGAKPIIDKIHISRGTPIILYNGAIIVRHHTKSIIYSKSITESTAMKIKKLIEHYDLSAYATQLNPSIYYENCGIISSDCESVFGWGVECCKNDYNGLPIIWNHADPIVPNTIVIEYYDQYRKDIIMKDLSQINDVCITNSGNRYLEITPVNCNKGQALKIIRQTCNWPIGSVLCIADNDNDVPLLMNADIGVVVDNASENAKAVADYKCAFPNVQGVVDVCEVLKAAKRYYTD